MHTSPPFWSNDLCADLTPALIGQYLCDSLVAIEHGKFCDPRTKNQRTCHTLRFYSHDNMIKTFLGYVRMEENKTFTPNTQSKLRYLHFNLHGMRGLKDCIYCYIRWTLILPKQGIVQELCESRGGRPGLSVLTSLLVSVDVKNYWTVLQHWSQLVPNMSTDIWGH